MERRAGVSIGSGIITPANLRFRWKLFNLYKNDKDIFQLERIILHKFLRRTKLYEKFKCSQAGKFYETFCHNFFCLHYKFTNDRKSRNLVNGIKSRRGKCDAYKLSVEIY